MAGKRNFDKISKEQPGTSQSFKEESFVDETWNEIKPDLQRIFKLEGITRSKVMHLYSKVHSFCTDTTREIVPPDDYTSDDPRPRSSSYYQGWELYGNTKEFLKAYNESLLAESRTYIDDDALLTFYTNKWNEYQLASKVLNIIFKYLNQHWVVREHEEKNTEVYDIYQLAMVMWKNHLFQELNEKLTNSILCLIERDRNHELTQVETKKVVAGVLNSYVELGSLGPCKFCKCKQCIEFTSEKGDPGLIYKECFEKKFLEETKHFYTLESASFVNENPVTEYLKKIENRLNDEHERIKRYLHKSTKVPLIVLCHQVLISGHIDCIQNEFVNLLKYDQNEDMERMYTLLIKVENGLGPLADSMGDYITEQGLSAINTLGEDNEKYPGAYVDAILRVHKKYHSLVVREFSYDARFASSLDKAFSKFVNYNSATEKTKIVTNKTPELLAKYCDQILKKSNKQTQEQDLEDLLNQVMVIFHYIEDKDVFEKFYSNRLALRIVQQLSASDDAEANMIAKLKQACGFEYTNKLQNMFKDIELSKDLNSRFKKYLTQNNDTIDLDFHAQILSAGAWPFKPTCSISLPSALANCVEKFNSFYVGQHSGRKLTWLNAPQMSKAEIVANCFQNKYTFQVSAIQMAILLHYNDKDRWTLIQLKEKLSINKDDHLIHSLQLLLKAKLLLLENNDKPKENSNKSEINLDENSSLALFKNYKSKKLRMNLNVPMRKQEKVETDATHQAIAENRKHELEACIVRTMKSRNILPHSELMSEVADQCKNRFKPEFRDIKKAIDSLIDREYMGRMEDESNRYKYIV